MLSRWVVGRPLQLLMDAALGQDCALCGARSRELVCAPCEADLPRDAAGLAVFAYRFPVDALVQRFKAGGDLAIGRWLSNRLAAHVRDEARPHLVVAPPLTAKRLRKRGFNQAQLVAHVVAKSLGVRCVRR